MTKIAILTGGTSSEREVSIKSSKLFLNNLNREVDYYIFPEDLDKFLENKTNYELIIPVFHGQYGEDGMIFAFLNSLNLCTTFSPFSTHSICLDKFKSNILVDSLGIGVPKQFIYNEDFELNSFPVIVKPNNGGSSIFTYKVDNIKDFRDKIDYIKSQTDDDILVQEFITGDEYSVSVVAGEVLPIMKVEKQEKGDFFDYDSKYISSNKMSETWPEIEIELKQNLENYTKMIYDFFGCKGFSRVDFLVTDNGIYFLEVNTIPGMTNESILPKSWLLTGRNFEELIQTIINDK